jgi:hypothetical protein
MRRHDEREEPEDQGDQGESDTGGADCFAILALEKSH